MSPSTAHALLIPITAALLTTGAAGPPEDADRAANGGGTVERRNVTADRAQERAVLDYWTPRRMEEATPVAGPGGAAENAPEDAEPLPVPDDDLGSEDPERQYDPDTDSTGVPWAEDGLVAHTTGKVFLTMDGRDFTCSASVVDSQNSSTLITAGHCAKDGTGSWAQNWTFVPGYADGEAPHGRFTARDLLVTPQWSDEADDSYDIAMAVVNPDGDETLQGRVGAQDISFSSWDEDQARDGHRVHAFGYPAAPPFDGRELHYCSGDTAPDTGGTTASGMGCSMTQGSSGGPWLTDFDPETGEGTVSSVVSFKYSDDLDTQYGPRLGEQARELFDSAQQL